jgi:hypothetical protein
MAYAVCVGILRFATLSAIGVGLLTALGQPQRNPQSSEYPRPEIREELTVVVDRVAETWQLRWTTPPKPVCGANEISMSMTCPCTGFAYGEAGDLYLLRLRNGSEIDRFHITPLFEEQFRNEGDLAITQRWPVNEEEDDKAGLKNEDISAIVTKRPTVQVMHLGDYDHDGQATEFYLQTEAEPCGKSVGVVVGISKNNPRLHALGTTSAPDKPLYLQRREWEALRDASGPVEVLDWPCGDHGADTETTLRLNWTAQGIEGTRREFTCTPEGKPGELLNEKQLRLSSPARRLTADGCGPRALS